MQRGRKDEHGTPAQSGDACRRLAQSGGPRRHRFHLRLCGCQVRRVTRCGCSCNAMRARQAICSKQSCWEVSACWNLNRIGQVHLASKLDFCETGILKLQNPGTWTQQSCRHDRESESPREVCPAALRNGAGFLLAAKAAAWNR